MTVPSNGYKILSGGGGTIPKAAMLAIYIQKGVPPEVNLRECI